MLSVVDSSLLLFLTSTTQAPYLPLVIESKSAVTVKRVDIGARRIIKNTNTKQTQTTRNHTQNITQLTINTHSPHLST